MAMGVSQYLIYLTGSQGLMGIFLHLIMIKKQFSALTLVDEWQRKCLHL